MESEMGILQGITNYFVITPAETARAIMIMKINAPVPECHTCALFLFFRSVYDPTPFARCIDEEVGEAARDNQFCDKHIKRHVNFKKEI